MKRGSLSSTQDGFTLIEVMVSLALGLVLVLAVQSLVVQAYRTAHMIEAREAERSVNTLVFELLEQDLAGLPAGRGVILEEGTLTFSTVHALQSPRMGARHAVAVSYTTRPRQDGRLELLRCEHELEEDPSGDSGVVLASGLKKVSWAVYDGQAWHAGWPTSVPRAARAIRATFESVDQPSSQRVLRLTPLHWRRHDE